jgi:SAM-dependent MidA family methyltransferase
MSGEGPASAVLRNLLQYGDLSFRDFVEIALYHPEAGYYSQASSPVGKAADYVTAPALSPVFGYAIGRLISGYLARSEAEVLTFVDVGCGDGSLLEAAWSATPERDRVRWWGIDRSLGRVGQAGLPVSDSGGQAGLPVCDSGGQAGLPVLHFGRSLLEVPRGGAHILFSNELFDAIPFSRLVMRHGDLHELWIDEHFDWTEHEAPEAYDDYFASHGIELEDGQFADVALDWATLYQEMAELVRRGLVVTLDYGFRAKQLFHPRIRRFGTAASYTRQRLTRDLLVNPGGQDLTAHVNFDDLIRAGESAGLTTTRFDRQAKFLLSLGITDHPLFAPLDELNPASFDEAMALREAREEARRLVLPDGIGDEIRVLIQERIIP